MRGAARATGRGCDGRRGNWHACAYDSFWRLACQKLRHSRGLLDDVVLLGDRPRRRIRPRKLCARAQAGSDRVDAAGIDEDTRLGSEELGRSTDARGGHRTLARESLEHRLAERLDQTRLADDVARRDQIRDAGVGDATQEKHAVAALELGAERTVTREHEAPAVERGEGIRQANDVLALVERPHTEVERPLTRPAELLARDRRPSR